MVQLPLHRLRHCRVAADVPHDLLAVPPEAQLEVRSFASPLTCYESLEAKRRQVVKRQAELGKASGFDCGTAVT